MKYCQFLFNSWKFSRAAFKGTVAPNLLISFLAYFSLRNVSYQNSRRTLNLRDGYTNLKSLWFVHTFLGEPLTNWGKIRWICKNVSNKNDELYIYSSPSKINTLRAVLWEGNSKSPRTAACICQSFSEISGISEIFWY